MRSNAIRHLFSSALFAAAMAVGGAAVAQAPSLLPVQGVLYDADGEPVEGPVTVTFAIYDGERVADPAWTETQRIVATRGLFAAYLGDTVDVDLATFAGSSDLWLGITVGDDSEMERIRLGSSPFAGHAAWCGDADTLGGDDADAIIVDAMAEAATRFAPLDHDHDFGDRYAALGHDHDGTYAPTGHTHDERYSRLGHGHAWGEITGIPGEIADGDDADTLGGMSCANGQVPTRSGASWVCGTPGDITAVTAGTGLTGGATSGNASLAVRFGGTGAASTVARSDHNHDSEYTVRYDRDGVSQTAYTYNPQPYLIELTAAASGGDTRRIPHDVITGYCGDRDGCIVQLGMRQWGAAWQQGSAMRTFHFQYGANRRWRSSYDTEAYDGDGGTHHVINGWDTCYFTDGEYVDYSQRGDAVGMNLLMWNGNSYAGRSCWLMIRD